MLRIIALLLAFAGSCKTSQRESNIESAPAMDSESQTWENLAYELQKIINGIMAGQSGIDSSQVALSGNETEDTLKSLSFHNVDAKLTSVDGHLNFLVKQLDNPKSTYRREHKHEDKLTPAEERMLIFSKKALEYSTKVRGVINKYAPHFPEASKNKNILQSPLVPQKAKAYLRESYGVLDRLDAKISGIQATIEAKEEIEARATQWASDFSSFLKGSTK